VPRLKVRFSIYFFRPKSKARYARLTFQVNEKNVLQDRIRGSALESLD
jgi:hypothetical protein